MTCSKFDEPRLGFLNKFINRRVRATRGIPRYRGSVAHRDTSADVTAQSGGNLVFEWAGCDRAGRVGTQAPNREGDLK